MADITIRMVFNQKTGKKDIWIEVTREEDALPYEHERTHREIIERLLGEGILTPDDVGQVQVRRGHSEAADEAESDASQDAAPEEEALSSSS